MPRPRVLSFMSQWAGAFHSRSPSSSTPNSPTLPVTSDSPTLNSEEKFDSPSRGSPKPPRGDDDDNNTRRGHSRRSSMLQSYQPPVIEMAADTLPELAPIFSYINSHSNKLYQEGYFLKLHDLDARGRPSADRVWNECFAQLVGTVLSLWDAAQLDAAGEDGEVIPTFVNLTDASIKMIESLPMNTGDSQNLQNVLSISTAANNRYLLHFNSLHSLTQWTAGIRLAIFEHSSLQEAYTGSIIAGKGKHLNNIRTIMERARFPTEDWVRVRFGAGTPWRRCWCVVTPPDEKELNKVQKAAKKRSAYEKAPAVKGDIKFYDSRKVTKKTTPIATIKDAFGAYAIYPQSKGLIEQSTLVKVEGKIVIHSNPETTTEGFVFMMPEVHPAVTGFEIMLRFLLPIFDTFNLYGRPNRLIADVLDSRSLMFAMPINRRYGYLDLIDVAGLIHTEGSQNWAEYDWRKQMKQLTAKRMSGPGPSDRAISGDHSRRGQSQTSINGPSPGRPSFTGSHNSNGVRYSMDTPKSSPGSAAGSRTESRGGSHPDSPTKGANGMYSPSRAKNASDTSLPYRGRSAPHHQRASSDAYRPQTGSRLSFETPRPGDAPPTPPHHASRPSQPPTQDASLYQTPQQRPPPPPMHRSLSGQPPPQQPQVGPDFSHNLYPPPQFGPQGPPTPQHANGVGRQWYSPEQSSHLRRDEFPPVQGYEESWGANDSPPMQDRPQSNGYSRDSPTSGTLSRPFTAPEAAPFADQNRPFNPVAAPPSFVHKSNAQPRLRPNQMPEMRRANSAIDSATLAQLAEANHAAAGAGRSAGPPPRARDDSQLFGGPLPNQGSPYPPHQPGRSQTGQTSYHSPHPSMNLPERRLPTIPGTPAGELEGFGLRPDSSRGSREATRERSANSISRKPVPSRSPQNGRTPDHSRTPEG